MAASPTLAFLHRPVCADSDIFGCSANLARRFHKRPSLSLKPAIGEQIAPVCSPSQTTRMVSLRSFASIQFICVLMRSHVDRGAVRACAFDQEANAAAEVFQVICR